MQIVCVGCFARDKDQEIYIIRGAALCEACWNWQENWPDSAPMSEFLKLCNKTWDVADKPSLRKAIAIAEKHKAFVLAGYIKRLLKAKD